MADGQLIKSFRDALTALLDLDDEDNAVEAWERRAIFDFQGPEDEIWQQLDVDDPPQAFTLMIRDDGTREMAWRHARGKNLDKCPVVELTPEGETTVLAANASDWIDTLLYTGGTLACGLEDDLQVAREEAPSAALNLSSAILEELDRNLAHSEVLGDRWDEAQEKLGDAWSDAAEGLD